MEHSLQAGRDHEVGCPRALQRRLLLVEDNSGDADFVRAIIGGNFECSFQLDHEARLERALARLTSAQYDLALLDLNLPDAQGMESFIRIHDAVPTLPIVILTGEDDFEKSLEAVRSGAQDYLCKSQMSGGQLVRSLRFAMERQYALLDATAKAMTDSLTGLRNRRGLTETATQIFATSRRLNTQITLLSIDVDGLKWINDTLGHKTGDQAIIEASEVLRATFRDCDIVSRLGGDEFVVLAVGALNGTEAETRQAIVGRVQYAVDERNTFPDRTYKLSLSIGAVSYDPDRHATLDVLLSEADHLMYEQKRQARSENSSARNLSTL